MTRPAGKGEGPKGRGPDAHPDGPAGGSRAWMKIFVHTIIVSTTCARGIGDAMRVDGIGRAGLVHVDRVEQTLGYQRRQMQRDGKSGCAGTDDGHSHLFFLLWEGRRTIVVVGGRVSRGRKKPMRTCGKHIISAGSVGLWWLCHKRASLEEA